MLRDEIGAVPANLGFAGQFSGKMIDALGIGPLRMGRVGVCPQHPVDVVRITDAMIAAEPLELLPHAEASFVVRDAIGWASGDREPV